MIFQRQARGILKEISESYPIVAITGPRQSGKTTLAKTFFAGMSYVSLEDLDNRAFAIEDPKGFLTQSNTGLIIDEIQNVPELFSYLQTIADKKQTCGQFVITGSQQFGLFSNITQSLAGRVGLLELLPFSIAEAQTAMTDLDTLLFSGLYPPIYDRNIKPHLWCEDYVKTYIERDVRKLINVKDLSLFQRFLSLCAARTGQLINYSELSNASGLDSRTIQSWLSVLEASYIIFRLKPHHKNFSKKLIKTPKLYFYDTGLLCYLLKIRQQDILLSPYRGSIFESLIVSEFIKFNKNHRLGQEFYFWRDNKGVEVDLLFEKAQKIFAIEIKSGKTIHTEFYKNLTLYQKYAATNKVAPYLIHGGNEKFTRNNIPTVPWSNMKSILDQI